MTILTPPPTAPDITDPDTFASRADAEVAWRRTNVTEMEALLTALAGGFVGTSTTSLAIGTGDKTFTTQSGLGFQPGQPVVAASLADPTDQMLGVVKTYSGTSLVITVASVGGSGTLADWVISLTAGAGGTMASQNADNVAITGGDITGVDDVYSKRFRSVVTAMAALAYDCALSDYQTKSISTNQTFTVTNVPAGAFGIRLKLTITSAAVPTWWSGVVWPGGSVPTLGNGTHFIDFFTDDGGTTWYAQAAKAFA